MCIYNIYGEIEALSSASHTYRKPYEAEREREKLFTIRRQIMPPVVIGRPNCDADIVRWEISEN